MHFQKKYTYPEVSFTFTVKPIDGTNTILDAIFQCVSKWEIYLHTSSSLTNISFLICKIGAHSFWPVCSLTSMKGLYELCSILFLKHRTSCHLYCGLCKSDLMCSVNEHRHLHNVNMLFWTD